MCLKFHLISMTIFHLISLVTEAKHHLLPRLRQNQIHIQTVHAAQDLQVLMENYSNTQKKTGLFYSEPHFNVAGVVGIPVLQIPTIAKLGVLQSRHVLSFLRSEVNS